MIDEREKDKCLFREDRHRMVKPKYYLVERTLLPEVFQRVIEANEAIASGKAATASEAAKIAGLSHPRTDGTLGCKPADGEPVHSDERNGIGYHFGPHR